MKKKNFIRIFSIVLIMCVFIVSTNVFAAGKDLKALLTDFKLFLNGKKVDKEVVVINGSSYLPVRAISEALGLDVNWDGNTNTINLKGSSSSGSGNETALKNTLSELQNKNDTLSKENADLKSQLNQYKGITPAGDGEKVPYSLTTGYFMERFDNYWNKQTPFKVKDKIYDQNVIGFKFDHVNSYKEREHSWDEWKDQGYASFSISNSDYKYNNISICYAIPDNAGEARCNIGVVAYSNVTGGKVLTEGIDYTKKEENGLFYITAKVTGFERLEFQFYSDEKFSPSYVLVFTDSIRAK